MRASCHTTSSVAIARRERLRSLAEAYGTLVVAILVFAFCALSTEVFLAPSNLRNILMQVSIVGVAAIGGTVVLLAGAIDLSVGGVVLLGAVVIGDLSERQGLPLPVALIGGFFATTIAGLVSGFLVAVVRVESILATLGTLLLSAGLARFILGPVWIEVGDEFFVTIARVPLVVVITSVLPRQTSGV